MARMILKWRYIKAGTPKHSAQLIKYIATREGVEKCDESWKSKPATKEQECLIKELVADFPDSMQSFEYRDYTKSKTKYSASEFIGQAIEENVDFIGKKENYVGYIAKRPRVEKDGAHGLFSQEDTPIDLSFVSKQVAEHAGVVWTTVLSLRREDAARLGYDWAKAWKDMLRSYADELARAMGIPLADLRWYAAFHNEGSHPHVHLISYSEGKQPYMTEQGLKKLKASYAREIFRQDLYHVYDEQTVYRNELKRKSREKIAEIIARINDGKYENETVELMLKTLSQTLNFCSGKKVYGYLPKKAKNLVNGIVDELAKDERIAKLYELWYLQKDEIARTYRETASERMPLSRNDEFKSVRNAVVAEAMNLISGYEPAEDEKEMYISDKKPGYKKIERKVARSKKTMWELYFWAKALLDKENEEYDPKRAVGLLIESASRGNAAAEYQLGEIYFYGREVKCDEARAMEYLNSAAKHGNEYAMRLLDRIKVNREQFTDELLTRGVFRLFQSVAKVLQNKAEEQYGNLILTDGKLRRKIQEKRQAQGLKYE